MAGKFVIEKAKDGQFYFNLKASNGQAILTSEMYKAKPSAQNGIESIQKNAADDGNYERKEAKNGKPYFVLKAPELKPRPGAAKLILGGPNCQKATSIGPIPVLR